MGLTYAVQTGPLSKNSSLNLPTPVEEESMLYIFNVQRVNFVQMNVCSKYQQNTVVQVGTALTF